MLFVHLNGSGRCCDLTGHHTWETASGVREFEKGGGWDRVLEMDIEKEDQDREREKAWHRAKVNKLIKMS